MGAYRKIPCRDLSHLDLAVQGAALTGQGRVYVLGTSAAHTSSVHITAVSQSALTGTLQHDGTHQAFALGYQSRYETPASLPLLEGRWHAIQGPGEEDWSISSTGQLSGRWTTGCTYAGQFSERPERKAVMDVAMTEDCAGAKVDLQGVATLHPSGALSMVVVTQDQRAAVALSLKKVA